MQFISRALLVLALVCSPVLAAVVPVKRQETATTATTSTTTTADTESPSQDCYESICPAASWKQ
ncbi:hypothetical protein FRB95_005034 [Tulasnella sp. JGI-2019a]|nr:hypothetical protein FRB95_005034 [Tulasnella sp. JGI-2019a]